MATNDTRNLYNVHITTCCRRSGPSLHRIADLKRNCRIRLFREITSFDAAQDDDHIFPTSGAFVQCQANSLRDIVDKQKEKLIQLQTEIEKYFILLKFSQCYNYFGQNFLLRRLKQLNSNDHPVQYFEHWKDCTQFLSNFNARSHQQNALQEQIYSIVREYGIDKPTWDAIFILNNRRNQEIHSPINEQDATWLKGNASKYQRFEIGAQDSRRSSFMIAVEKFADALCSQFNRHRLAQPSESSFTKYKNPYR
jgi:hypothetical protein